MRYLVIDDDAVFTVDRLSDRDYELIENGTLIVVECLPFGLREILGQDEFLDVLNLEDMIERNKMYVDDSTTGTV